jgi:glucose/arabinose dehydrogenase
MILRVSTLACLASCFVLAACGKGDGDEESAETTSATQTTDASGTQTASGDGDSATSDATGDGDSATGDGDSATGDGDSATGDGDATTGDGDGDLPPCPYDEVGGTPNMGFELVANGFDRPVDVKGHPQVPNRLYVIEQFTGRIKILEPGETSAPTNNLLELDVRTQENEVGLLGFTFHPDFPEDPRFYVNYNPGSGGVRTRISEFTVTSDPEVADPSSERILMEFDQPYWNHDGGGLAFGPDGYLYIGVGDGGSGGDPLGSGQDTSTLLGSILRIDVTPGGGEQYSIPADNPFVGQAGFREEIWAYGMRNPFRFSFDDDGTLYVGDVGQDAYEEISVVEGGQNHGWNDMEGFHCYTNGCDAGTTPNGVNSDQQVYPIYEYDHGTGYSITGGHVYRSCEVPGWHGAYVFADYNSTVFTLTWDGTNVTNAGSVFNAAGGVVSFGDNAWGDVYGVVFNSSGTDSIYRLAPQ